MRRAFVGLAVTTVAVLALAGPANAAPGQVTHSQFNGPFADAVWSSSSATSSTNTFVNVFKSRQGSATLFVDQLIGNLDANGNFTGGTDTFAFVTSGFSFTIDAKQLTTASVSGSGLPATTCTLDASGNEVGCTDTTIDVNVTWIGQGPISRGTSTSHSKADGFSLTIHTNGTDRNATATGTVGGLAMGDSQFADLGNSNSGQTTLCIGNSC
jgi:hypothetical protein